MSVCFKNYDFEITEFAFFVNIFASFVVCLLSLVLLFLLSLYLSFLLALILLSLFFLYDDLHKH